MFTVYHILEISRLNTDHTLPFAQEDVKTVSLLDMFVYFFEGAKTHLKKGGKTEERKRGASNKWKYRFSSQWDFPPPDPEEEPGGALSEFAAIAGGRVKLFGFASLR